MESYDQVPEEEFAPQYTQKPLKHSPFENSPYEMNHQTDTQPPFERFSQPPVSNKPKRKGAWKVILSCVCAVALIVGSCGITAFSLNRYWEQKDRQTNEMLDQLYRQIQELKKDIQDNSFTGNGNSISGSTNTSSEGLTPGQVYAKCVGSVVAIVAQSAQSGSSGSGFILSSNGYILTNYHVIQGNSTITVTVYDGTEYPATAIGYDDTNDIALIKIEAEGLPYATIGSSDDLIVGDQVVAIGNPLGELTSTLTVGYISAKERDITTDGTIINMLQTDAAINPGNSGGPLFNMKGEVVGIITAKYSGSTASGASIEGIGFAIPVDDITGKVEEIRENGYVSTPYLGVMVNNQNQGMGAYVVSVESDGGAYAAGVRAGDIIVGLGDQDITCVEDISKVLRNFKVGDTTTITVYRSRKLLDLTITFGERPQTDTQTSTDDVQIPENNSQTPDSDDYPNWWDFFFGN